VNMSLIYVRCMRMQCVCIYMYIYISLECNKKNVIKRTCETHSPCLEKKETIIVVTIWGVIGEFCDRHVLVYARPIRVSMVIIHGTFCLSCNMSKRSMPETQISTEIRTSPSDSSRHNHAGYVRVTCMCGYAPVS
jgi:hypothetical protein